MADSLIVPYQEPGQLHGCSYCLKNADTVYLTSDSLSITVIDSTNSFDTQVIVPDTFSILNLVPFNHIVGGLSDNVTLSWSGSAGTEGYILAAVKADSAYKGQGYSAAVATQTTGGTIPPDAFQLDGSIVPDTGLYNVYVYIIVARFHNGGFCNEIIDPVNCHTIELSKGYIF